MSISILMSTYNGEKYIEKQLFSILNQTMQVDELVIIDDCSTDNTTGIIESFIHDHNLEEKWKLHVNEVNQGWRVNFFEGIAKTQYDIVMFSDQDDIWFDNKVELVNQVLENHAEVDVVASKETLWNGTGEYDLSAKSELYRIIELEKSGKEYFIHCSGCTMAFRRTYYDKIKNYHGQGWAHDDFFWKFGIIDGRFALLEESTILHRIHGKNESRKKRTLKASIYGCEIGVLTAKQLLKYMADNKDSINDYSTKQKIVKHKLQAETKRLEFLKTGKKNRYIWLLFKGTDIYRRKRQIVKDYLLVHNRKGE